MPSKIHKTSSISFINKALYNRVTPKFARINGQFLVIYILSGKRQANKQLSFDSDSSNDDSILESEIDEEVCEKENDYDKIETEMKLIQLDLKKSYGG